jgi:hypothetical protein
MIRWVLLIPLQKRKYIVTNAIKQSQNIKSQLYIWDMLLCISWNVLWFYCCTLLDEDIGLGPSLTAYFYTII